MILPSGISSLDRLLNGGLHTGLITHVYGEAGSGKSTLALQFVNAACRIGIRTAYVNSESTSPIERLEQMSGQDFNELEDLVRIIVPKSFDEQGAIVDDLELYAREDTRLVVMDTFTRLYRIVLDDEETTYAAHRELNRQAGFLKGLAKHKAMAILVLNQVRASINGPDVFEPVAMNVLDYWSDYVLRIRIRKTSGERLVERLRPEGEPSKELVYLTKAGFSKERAAEKK
jgi:RecA/RadA recombinase